MKSESLPSLRVEPELRKTAEAVLEKGETLSAFIESSVRTAIEMRLNRKEFIARGLASRDCARETGAYVEASLVLEELQGMLRKAGKRSS